MVASWLFLGCFLVTSWFRCGCFMDFSSASWLIHGSFMTGCVMDTSRLCHEKSLSIHLELNDLIRSSWFREYIDSFSFLTTPKWRRVEDVTICFNCSQFWARSYFLYYIYGQTIVSSQIRLRAYHRKYFNNDGGRVTRSPIHELTVRYFTGILA